MVRIPGGTFRMGSNDHYPEEAPVHRAMVDGFWIDCTPVTNRQFKAFVKATGHKTYAEIPPDPKDYPGAVPDMLYAGSLVFVRPSSTFRSARLEPVVDLHEGRRLAASLRSEEQHQTCWAIIPSCTSPMPMRLPTRDGRQGPADRSRMGFAARGGLDGAEFAWAMNLRLWRACGQHLAGRIPPAEFERGWLRTHVARKGLPAERATACTT